MEDDSIFATLTALTESIDVMVNKLEKNQGNIDLLKEKTENTNTVLSEIRSVIDKMKQGFLQVHRDRRPIIWINGLKESISLVRKEFISEIEKAHKKLDDIEKSIETINDLIDLIEEDFQRTEDQQRDQDKEFEKRLG